LLERSAGLPDGHVFVYATVAVIVDTQVRAALACGQLLIHARAEAPLFARRHASSTTPAPHAASRTGITRHALTFAAAARNARILFLFWNRASIARYLIVRDADSGIAHVHRVALRLTFTQRVRAASALARPRHRAVVFALTR
jgi:hypothetical protein